MNRKTIDAKYKTLIEKYIDQGCSYKEAESKAFRDLITPLTA